MAPVWGPPSGALAPFAAVAEGAGDPDRLGSASSLTGQLEAWTGGCRQEGAQPQLLSMALWGRSPATLTLVKTPRPKSASSQSFSLGGAQEVPGHPAWGQEPGPLSGSLGSAARPRGPAP